MNSGYRPKDLARNWRRETSEAIYHTNHIFGRAEDRERIEYDFGASGPQQRISRRREGKKIIIEID